MSQQRFVTPSPDQVDVVLRGFFADDVSPYARSKVAHAARLSGRSVLAAKVVLERSSDPAVSRPVHAQAVLDVSGTPVRAEADGVHAQEAVDRVADRLERRLDELLARREQRSRGPRPGSQPA